MNFEKEKQFKHTVTSELHLSLQITVSINPAKTYLLKVHNRNTRKRREICSNLTTKI